MAMFESSYSEGGVSYWTGFNDPTGDPLLPFSENSRSRPGSYRLRVNENFFKPRTSDDDESMITLDYMKDTNRKSHHCDKYGVKNLVVRRGQEFQLKVTLAAPFDKNNDRLTLVFTKGDRPKEGKGTLLRIPIYADKSSAQKAQKGFDWLGYRSSLNTTNHLAEITVNITAQADAFVGKYKVQTHFFKLDFDGEVKKRVKKEDEEIYMLFNPWCETDQVYMEKDQEKDEYVLNETGKIWVGSAFWNSGRSWNFGQFATKSLEAAVYLLDESYMYIPETSHGNATAVCRVMSAMANSNSYDGGVLTGNWSGDYSDGISPSKWNGSVAILEKFMENKRAVEYGQCWVFSGLLTTLCRSLGIPTRSVTNFDSAHDHDYSMTIDTHIDENGETLEGLNDSVWNFHVWNEAWFKRPDLPKGYDGWQAFDATPQEESEGAMQCGPAPLNAIKEGNVFLGYDTKFIFGEVNGDRVTWMVDSKTDERTPVNDKLEKDSVGQKISTKSIWGDARNDVTDLYKFKEGSTEERVSVKRAMAFSSRKEDFGNLYHEKIVEDVQFTWEDEIVEGDISVRFTITNKSDKPREVFLRAIANAIYYTGAKGKRIGDTSAKGYLQPGQKATQTLKLNAHYYLNLIDEDAKANVAIFAKVLDTKQIWRKEKRFELEKPDPVLELSNTRPKIGEKFTLTIRIKNPVKTTLTNGVIHLEGPGIQKNKEIIIDSPIKVGEEISRSVTLAAKFPGKRELIVCFNSRQITNVNGSVEVEVVE